ncbi:MAG: dolichyl-diphosphooligosaccharide--protein glycosyltransferase subunit STT3 [Nanoarchaeota archaeon]|nr:dolichyl-diphosphooligosaccharide--protein glycosyltransferase subunit STT3 [Nanoarchaeota archaeon]
MVQKSKTQDFGFNFSKTFNSFKKKKKDSQKKESNKTIQKEPSKKTMSFGLEPTKLMSVFQNKAFITIILILIPLFFSVFFRMYSANLPATEDWAYSTAYNNIRSQVTSQINAQYPNLPSSNKNQLIEQKIAEVFEQQGEDFFQQIKNTADYFKSRFQDDSGQTYLLAIDPYHYFRLTRNMVEKWHVWDVIKDGQPWDDHRLAPVGRAVKANFHVYFEYYLYKFISFFNKDATLLSVVFLVPVIISSLCVIPAFFIAKKRAGKFAGFIAAMLVGIHSAFIGRTAAGFADTDAYNVFFPLFIAWVFIEAFEAKEWNKKLLLGAVSGFLVGLYSIAWIGWWYIFDFIMGAVIIYILYRALKLFIEQKTFKKIFVDDVLKKTVCVMIVFFLFACIFTSIFTSFPNFQNSVFGPLTFRTIKQAAKTDLWPNVYTTVAELNPASISSVVNQIGGKFFFFIASIGVLLTLFKLEKANKKDFVILGIGILVFLIMLSDSVMQLEPITFLLIFAIPIIIGLIFLLKDKREIDIKYALFLVLWFAGTIYACTKGTRFILLLVPAFSIAFGIALGIIMKALSYWTSKEFEINKKYVTVALIILLSLLLIAPVKSAHITAKGEIPSMNDAWWASLTKIKEESAPNAIVNSWWDFGHWFKAVADRAVTFDGGSQNTPMAHWVGKILLTSDEDQAVAILKMLDCGSNNAFEEIDLKFSDTEKSANIVYEVLKRDEDNAKKYLEEQGFTFEEITKITPYFFCEPPENYFITSGDMIGKAGVWAHFGSWDFDKAFIYNNVRNKDYQESVELLMERFNISEDKAADYYYEVQSLTTDRSVNDWISPWPNYLTARWVGCKNETKEIVTCTFNFPIGQSNLNQQVRIENVIINLSSPEKTLFTMAFIDSNIGVKAAETKTNPKGLVIAKGDELTKYDLGSADMNIDVVYDADKKKALMMDPSLSQSIFTKLFFLEGRSTKHFNVFSDETDVTGSRIIVWKVDWDGEKDILENVNQTTVNTNINATLI